MPQLTVEQALEAARRYHQAGQFAQAEAVCRQILEQQPQQADALHLLGIIAFQAGRHEMAVEMIGRGVALQPNHAGAHLNLGIALQSQGRLDEAAAACRQAIALKPGFAEAHFNLGNALYSQGQRDAAIVAYRQAVALKPNYSQALVNLGNALRAQGQLDEAAAAHRQAIACNPTLAEAHNNLGVTLQSQGRLDEALAAFRQAIALRPDYPEAHYNLGVARKDQGQLDEALIALRQAIALKGGYPDAYSSLGVVLEAQGQLDAALAAHRQAIALKPDWPEAHYNFGVALQAGERFDEASAAYRQAIALKPGHSAAWGRLGAAQHATGEIDEALAALRQAVDLAPDNAGIHSTLVFALHFDPAGDARTLAGEQRRWAQRHAAPLHRFIQPHANDRDPERRLRIGYFSPRLCLLPEGRFLLPLLRARERSRLEVICYSDGRQPDGMTALIRQSADGWRDIAGWPDARVADLVRQDGIDIAVDLMLHGDNNRLLVLARKPAPVQVTYLAYCSSTGLSTIDYRLSDPYLDPPGMDESVYSERTMRLPETYWCYQPILAPPGVHPLPALERGHITFGCLNSFSKVSEGTLAAWAELLRAVPNADLLLHATEGRRRARVREGFAREGVATERLRFAGVMPIEQYFALYRQIDIALDTFPFGGGTTTCDALWMGVPVVSLVGRTAVGRGGLSILSNVGLPELAARSEGEYVRIARDLAGDLPRLERLRSTLRQRMEQSPLMDAPRFARAVEAAYRQMWRQWCATSSGAGTR